ncbi:conserved hypothetical protein [Vibrio crassostreae]|nr:conserved hypothetical protein [Vibrio crassostreae]CAK3225349.1 conserved hypothetical protein [Vibrio crassostreae]
MNNQRYLIQSFFYRLLTVNIKNVDCYVSFTDYYNQLQEINSNDLVNIFEDLSLRMQNLSKLRNNERNYLYIQQRLSEVKNAYIYVLYDNQVTQFSEEDSIYLVDRELMKCEKLNSIIEIMIYDLFFFKEKVKKRKRKLKK